ncbi:MAG: glycerophosphodiester phosphodiesterase [Actinomycetota bacterium]|nr:glycerophosphodiester phosphodiesterase [Actinomycetota bacterium]
MNPEKRPLVIAHRGASSDFPENSLEAFSGAFEQGADWIELDVRRSKDGVLVVHHDAHLSDGRLIRDLDSNLLPEEVPSLAEAFEASENMGVNVEIKHLPGEPDFEEVDLVCEAVVGLVRAYREDDKILVSSFDMNAIDRIKETDQSIPTGWLVAERNDGIQILDRVEAHNHTSINPWDGLVDEALVQQAHSRGLAVNVWTVDDERRILELSDWGVDGIITNFPGLAVKILDQEF